MPGHSLFSCLGACWESGSSWITEQDCNHRNDNFTSSPRGNIETKKTLPDTTATVARERTAAFGEKRLSEARTNQLRPPPGGTPVLLLCYEVSQSLCRVGFHLKSIYNRSCCGSAVVSARFYRGRLCLIGLRLWAAALTEQPGPAEGSPSKENLLTREPHTKAQWHFEFEKHQYLKNFFFF